MLASVLKRPKRLPRKFRRHVTPAMRTFAARRHKRRTVGSRERIKRWWRKTSAASQGAWTWVRRWFWLVIGGIAALAMSVALFSPLLDVREIRVVRGQGRVDVGGIQRALSPLFGRHLLFLSASDVEERVRDAVPDLEAVEIDKQFPSRLFLRVRLKPLIARLELVEPPGSKSASASVAATTGSGALSGVPELQEHDYLTENGLLVSTTSVESGAVLPLVRVVDWGVRPAPKTRLLPPEFLQRMLGTERVLTTEFGQTVSSRTLYLRAQEFHLTVGKIELWFDLQSTLEEQLTRYRLFLKTVGLAKATRYVDLRIKGRVVYR